jgi:hypothetical protein
MPLTKNSTSRAAAEATDTALPTLTCNITTVSFTTAKLSPVLNEPTRPSVTVPPAGPNPRPATVNITATLLAAKTTDGVNEASARGAKTVTNEAALADTKENGPNENPQTKPTLEADKNERTLSRTENTERSIHDSASKSVEAPICSSLGGNKFDIGKPRLFLVPSPSWYVLPKPQTKSLLKLVTRPIDHPLLDETDEIVSDAKRGRGTMDGG